MTIACRLCGNAEGNRPFQFREMFLCTKETFNYFECAECGSLQISEIPGSMKSYYPEDYYSFRSEELPDMQVDLKTKVKRYLSSVRDRYVVTGEGLAGRLIFSLYPNVEKKLVSLRGLCKTAETAILDVGCGSGELLLYLKRLGLNNLEGIDPYISKTIVHCNSVRIYKSELLDFDPGEKKYDIIMLHHVLEHLADPLEVLSRCRELLSGDGILIIRTPVAGTFGWREFAENWVQLDAPRHLIIHSVDSLKNLSKKSGLKFTKLFFDSTEFLFWGSIQYRKGICLNSENSYMINPSASIFSKGDITKFRRKAGKLNASDDGDQCVLYLAKE